jgi:hypothetical protein
VCEEDDGVCQFVAHEEMLIEDRSQFEARPLKEYVEDRNMMSTKRQDLVSPERTNV